MVARDYAKRIDAVIIEKMPVEEPRTLDDLRARKSSPTCLSFTQRGG